MDINLFVLDFETTGLNPYLDHVIEVAIKKVTANDYYQTLIKPPLLPPGLPKYIPPHIVNITHITDKMIEDESIEPSIAIFNMIKYIKNHSNRGPIYIISHNGTTFDDIILKRLMKEYNVSERIIKRLSYIDTLLFSKMFIKVKNYRQKDLCKRYNITNDSEHRALGDINALEEIYIELCNEYTEKEGKEERYYIENPDEIIEKLLIE